MIPRPAVQGVPPVRVREVRYAPPHPYQSERSQRRTSGCHDGLPQSTMFRLDALSSRTSAGSRGPDTAIWEASGKAGLSELGNCSGLLPPLLNSPPTSAESAMRLGMRGLAQLHARALHNIPEAAGGNLSAQCWTPTGRGEGSCRRSQSRPRNTRCSGRCPPLALNILQQHRMDYYRQQVRAVIGRIGCAASRGNRWRGSQSRRPDVTLLVGSQPTSGDPVPRKHEHGRSLLLVFVWPVVVSLGCSPRKPRLARCRHDELSISYEPDLLFVSVCFEIAC